MSTLPDSSSVDLPTPHALASQLARYSQIAIQNGNALDDPVIKSAIDIASRVRPMQVDSNMVGAVANHVGQLLTQSHTAGELQTYFLDEIDTRTGNLRDCLATMIDLLQESSQNAQQLESRTNASLVSTADDIQVGLDSIRTELEGKSKRTSETLDAISDIGQSINLLAVNANIEAARAGEHGHAFAIVAAEVRALAQKTMERTEEAVRVVDLTETTTQMDNAIETAKDSLDLLRQLVADALTELRAIFKLIAEQQMSIDDNSQIIFEMLTNTRVAQKRGFDKVSRAQDDLRNGMNAVGQTTSDSAAKAFLAQTTYWAPGQDDMLGQILRRKKVRVGIEPNFVGLSFRPNKSGPLSGLDAEYVRAFAQWLGVEVEFVEYDWDQLTELLYVGRRAGEPPVDLVWSALPPSPTYNGVAYSNTYTYLPFALCRRNGDESISDVASLEGKILGIINDPGAFDVLQSAGLRWAANRGVPNGAATLANLVPYSDQSRIHDCLVEGAVDAFAVDLPIYYWACHNLDSPWHGKIEILPTVLAEELYYYSVATRAQPEAFRLLAKVNQFIAEFSQSPKRAALERTWQGRIYSDDGSYRDDPATSTGEAELRKMYESCQVMHVKNVASRVA